MADENNLLTNKLFLQYLAGTGAAIGSGESPAAAMGGIHYAEHTVSELYEAAETVTRA